MGFGKAALANGAGEMCRKVKLDRYLLLCTTGFKWVKCLNVKPKNSETAWGKKKTWMGSFWFLWWLRAKKLGAAKLCLPSMHKALVQSQGLQKE